LEHVGKQEIWYYDNDPDAKKVDSITSIRSGRGHPVRTFLELATKVADLQFRNREHVLLFRGQGGDHKNQQQKTTLKPSLFRAERGRRSNPDQGLLTERFGRLENAERQLVGHYQRSKLLGIERLRRHRILRWAILQHYEVCFTPLLDVTHSLRIAASFASQDQDDEAFLFVLGVPNLGGAITASAEAGLQIVRLSSVCPPTAVRPHLQEGYLLGEYPDMAAYDQKQLYHHYEIDFGRRLVAKFRFVPSRFWKSDTFPQVARKALYPTPAHDPLCKLALEVKNALG
jgi:hypothetical protein